MTVVIRPLGPEDPAALDAFLMRHADSSLFLRSNLRAAGLVDEGQPFQATYAGAFAGGEIHAVAAHCWNGNVLVQAPVHAGATAREAIARSGRAVTGVSGPWAQVCAVRDMLAVAPHRARVELHDELFAVALSALRIPPLLDAPAVRCRPTTPADLDLVTGWRVAYCVEVLHATDVPSLRSEAREGMERVQAIGSAWLLEHDAKPVAFSMFNARLPDVVQIGGVFTPPDLRGRGYARAVVAGSLVAVRASGVTRAVLFTGDDNVAARRAYEAIGFRRIGDYGQVIY
jgi:GNAT superfamily N-acetyltransferase